VCVVRVQVGTDTAFMLGPWIAMARKFAGNATDCVGTGYPTITSCEKFYEWNARVQLTTWNPTPQGATKIPGGPIDYVSVSTQPQILVAISFLCPCIDVPVRGHCANDP
jgi:hypothetical protein